MLSNAEIASITDTVASALDVSLPLERNTPVRDTFGSTAPVWASVGNIACNVSKASSTMLTTYADVIGSQRAVMLRVMQTTDVREGDRISYAGLKWLIHEVDNAESYTWTNEYLAVVIV